MSIRHLHEHADALADAGRPLPSGSRGPRTDRQWVRDERGATTLEWALLLGAVALPSYGIIQIALATLIGHYQLMTSLNALPFP